jgi:ankyrin repeat protein
MAAQMSFVRQELLRRGSNANATNRLSKTALIMAASRGHKRCCTVSEADLLIRRSFPQKPAPPR